VALAGQPLFARPWQRGPGERCSFCRQPAEVVSWSAELVPGKTPGVVVTAPLAGVPPVVHCRGFTCVEAAWAAIGEPADGMTTAPLRLSWSQWFSQETRLGRVLDGLTVAWAERRYR
jgi:hypothetical protein